MCLFYDLYSTFLIKDVIRIIMIAWGIKWKSFVVFSKTTKIATDSPAAVISVVERSDHEGHALLISILAYMN
jgi:hypothetical protein